MKKSKWFWWSFFPFLNSAAWIHAAVRTNRNSYYWLAVVYLVPFNFEFLMGAMEEPLKLSKETVDRLTDFATTAEAVFWVGGMIHVLLKKDSVDRQIQDHDNLLMRPCQTPQNPPPEPPVQRLVNQRPTTTVVVERQPVVTRSGALSGALQTTVSEPKTAKTFKYIDSHGNLLGPATLCSLQGLQQAGVVTTATQILDEEDGGYITMAGLIGKMSATQREVVHNAPVLIQEGMGPPGDRTIGLQTAQQVMQPTTTQPGGGMPTSVAAQFHVAVSGQPSGPFTEPVLKQMASAGTLTANSLVWRQGMAGWQLAGTVPEISGLFASTSGTPPPLPSGATG